MTEQEIRAKALEITVKSMALLPTHMRLGLLEKAGDFKIGSFIIDASRIFEEHIKGSQD